MECDNGRVMEEEIEAAVLAAFGKLSEKKDELLRAQERLRIAGLAKADEMLEAIDAERTRRSEEENRAAAIAFLAPYIEAAKKAGVRIAIENLTNFGDGRRRHCGGPIEELIDLVDAINDPAVGICIDTGHANIAGLNVAEALRASGSRVIALHINDNYASLGSDMHQLPFMGDVDWADVMRAISEIGYRGHFTYEVGGARRRPDALYQDWLDYTVKVGRGLIAMLDEANG